METLSLFDQPRVRRSDPSTSAEAAARVAPGNAEQCNAIRNRVSVHGPGTAWQIAAWVRELWGDRWQEDSIRTACKRARLVKLAGLHGKSPGGRDVCIYALGEWQREQVVGIAGDVL